jgi:hypothetical protein
LLFQSYQQLDDGGCAKAVSRLGHFQDSLIALISLTSSVGTIRGPT